MNHELVIKNSVDYLSSNEAIKSIEANPYWPKWHSPWWHMSALFEMDMADRIPKTTAEKMLSEIKRTHLPYFFREDAPKDKKDYQDCPCPCSLGNIYQILNQVGLDVDAELPWARNWFLKYQMLDGGLSCDEDAYKSDFGASSIVGTIAPLEAILNSKKPLTDKEKKFLDLGAKCLIDRELRLGSLSNHNAEERLDEEEWQKLCFPRFYFYDVLRGLNFILKWADLRNLPIEKKSIEYGIEAIRTRFPDHELRVERHSYENVTTILKSDANEWTRGYPACHFPLLDQISQIGSNSPYLTARWKDAQALLHALSERGLVR